jgi:hypothetical protein
MTTTRRTRGRVVLGLVAALAVVGAIGVATRLRGGAAAAAPPPYLARYVDALDDHCAGWYAATDALVMDEQRAHGDLGAMAAPARRIAAADRAWLDRVEALPVPARGRAQVDALLRAATTYASADDEVATAAASGDAAGFRRARKAVGRADRDLSARMHDMGTSVCARGSAGDRPG